MERIDKLMQVSLYIFISYYVTCLFYAIYFLPYNFVIKLYFSQRNLLTMYVARSERVQLLGIPFFSFACFVIRFVTSLLSDVTCHVIGFGGSVAGYIGRCILFLGTPNEIIQHQNIFDHRRFNPITLLS
jgi:hypothetical protein